MSNIKGLIRSDEKDYFGQVIKNIKNLIKYKRENNGKVDVNVGYIVNSYNYNQIYDLAVILKEIGVHYLRIKTDIASILNLTPEQQNIADDQLKKIEDILVDENFKLVRIHRIGNKTDKKRNFNKCRVNKLFGSVGSDGYLYACNYHPSRHGVKYLNTLDVGFQYAWENSNKDIDFVNKCPQVCDPFKNRANNLLEVIDIQGINFR